MGIISHLLVSNVVIIIRAMLRSSKMVTVIYIVFLLMLKKNKSYPKPISFYDVIQCMHIHMPGMEINGGPVARGHRIFCRTTRFQKVVVRQATGFFDRFCITFRITNYIICSHFMEEQSIF